MLSWLLMSSGSKRCPLYFPADPLAMDAFFRDRLQFTTTGVDTCGTPRS